MDITEFLGKTCIKIIGTIKDSELEFYFDDGSIYRMYHSRNCCEQVYLEDIDGKIEDLIGVPMVIAYESTNYNDMPPKDEYDDCYLWTFYVLAAKAHVTLRWYGASNGYYSVDVAIECIKQPDKIQ